MNAVDVPVDKLSRSSERAASRPSVRTASSTSGRGAVRIPVAEAAKPRKIAVSATTPRQLGAAA